MRHALLALVTSSIATAPVIGAPIRAAAHTFAEAAPDQETFHQWLAPAPDSDVEDRAEDEQELASKINELEKALENFSGTKKATALLELAKLHQRRALDVRDAAIATYKSDYDQWWMGAAFSPPELKEEAWKDQMLRSINTLRTFTGEFQKDPRSAEAHWLIASAMARLGNDHCERYFKLAADLTKTPEWTNKIRISKADWTQASGKVDDAIKLYTDLRSTVTDDLKPYVTYRLGWALLSKGLSATAPQGTELVNKGEAALKLALIAQEKADVADEDTRFALRHAIAEDLAWLWASVSNGSNNDQDTVKDATEFFEKHDLKDMVAIYQDRRANEWIRRGQIDRAAAYYQAKMTANPEDPQRPDQYLRLAFAYVVAGNIPAFKETSAALTKITTDKEDPWFDKYAEDGNLMPRAKKMLELLPIVSAFKLYEAADTATDDKRKNAMLTESIKALQDQLRAIKGDEQALTIRTMIIKGLITLGRFNEALTHLDAIVAMGAKAGPQRTAAAMERLNILVKLDGEQTYPAIPGPGEVKSPLPLPELKSRFATAAQEYLAIVPDAEILPNLRFQIAQDLFNYGHYDEALPLFEKFVADFPRHEQSRTAIEICLSMNLKTKKWEELVRLSTNFLNNRDVKGKALRDYVKENLDWAREQVKQSKGSTTTN